MPVRRLLLGLALSLPCLGSLPAAPAIAADDLFEVASLSNEGRSVAAEIADLDGDGRPDLFVAILDGVPPTEKRVARVYLQSAEGRFPATPTFEKALPGWSAVYDVADVRADGPGSELILLRPQGLAIVSLASADAPVWELEVPGATTMGPSEDERGLEPFRIVHHHLSGEEPWLLVPQIGQMTAITPDGEVQASISLPRRANFFIMPPTGLISIESDFQVFIDAPKLLLGDIDGDGRNDIASATRHEIWVFLQREDGTFAFEPDRKHALGMVSKRDHIRGSGGVSSDVGDIDGDGRVDLVVTHIGGGFQDATTKVYVYLNRGGRWNLDAPDQTITRNGSVSSNALVDFDRDGIMELLRLEVSFSLLEVVELLVSREIDISLAILRFEPGVGYGKSPWLKRKLEVPFSFETFRPKGFIPTARTDVDGDGYVDFVDSGGGGSFELFPGGPNGFFRKDAKRQKMPTAGMIRLADFSGDGLADFVIFDPHNYDVPIQLGRNLGRSAQPSMRAQGGLVEGADPGD